MMIKRKPNWRSELAAYLAERQNMPFNLETNDCLKFASGAVQAMTGVDLMEGVPEYKTEREAEAVLKQLGYETHLDGVRKYFEEIPKALANPGDVAVFGNSGLGIIQGEYVYHPGMFGIALVDMAEVTAVYRVPE